MEDKKKSKKGLIAGIIAAVVVAGGAVAAFFIINSNNSPEKVALDAVTKTIKQPAHNMSGKIELSASTPYATEGGTSSTAKIVLEFSGENNGLDSSSATALTVRVGNTSDFVFRFDEVLQSNGVLYIKLSELTAFVNSILSSYGQYLTAEPLATIVSDVKALVTKVSANWWRISVPEILEMFDINNPQITEEYNCAVAATNDLIKGSSLDTIANLYKNNQFLNVKKSDKKISSFTGDSYEATIDTSKFAKFWNEFVTSDNVKKLNACIPERDTLSSVTPGELSAISNTGFLLDIDKNRNLNGIHFSDAKENYSIETDLRIEEGSEDLAIAAPSDAKPIADLTADIVKLAQSIAGLFAAAQSAE